MILVISGLNEVSPPLRAAVWDMSELQHELESEVGWTWNCLLSAFPISRACCTWCCSSCKREGGGRWRVPVPFYQQSSFGAHITLYSISDFACAFILNKASLDADRTAG